MESEIFTTPNGIKYRKHDGIYSYRSIPGHSYGYVDCPWCGREGIKVYIWSLSGSGKKCPKCKSLITTNYCFEHVPIRIMERKIFICDCHSLEHQVAFWYDEEEKSLYIEPHLVTHRNFFKRLWVGLKYTFGYKSRFGEFDEVILSPRSQKKLRDMLNAQT